MILWGMKAVAVEVEDEGQLIRWRRRKGTTAARIGHCLKLSAEFESSQTRTPPSREEL